MNPEFSSRDEPRGCGPADRQAAAALLGDTTSLELEECHAFVSGTGAAVWIEPPAGTEEAYLGAVIAAEGRPGRTFYELVLACADDALAPTSRMC